MSKENLVEKVVQYVKRAEQEKDIPSYPIDEEDTYKYITGNPSERSNDRRTGGIYTGRFIDVVATIVQKSDFYGFWCSEVNNSSNGYLIHYRPQIETVNEIEGLDDYVIKIQTLEEEADQLGVKLEGLNKQIEENYSK